MVAHVDDVEAPPLIGAEGAKEKVYGHALEAEALAGAVDEGVHAIEFLAEEVRELSAVHGRPAQLVGARKNGGGRAAGHVAEGEDHHLQKPLDGGAVAGSGTVAFETFLKHAAAAAAGENEMLDEILGVPEALVLVRMQLTPLRWPGGQLDAIGFMNLLQNGMHGKPRDEISLGELYHRPGDQAGGAAPISLRALRTSFALGPLGSALR